MSFSDVIDKYRRESQSQRDKGTKFEELMCRYFLTDPTYAMQLESVVLWNDFFAKADLGGKDTGIDLVAKTKTGEYWAIQCKCYAETSQVTKEDINTFLSTSERKFFDEGHNETQFSFRLIVATTNEWSSVADDALSNHTIRVERLSLRELENAPVDWDALERGLHGRSVRKRNYELKDHQREALDKAMAYYEDHDRGKMIMACGTGKTFTSLRITESLCKRDKAEKPCILFLAPSISLVGQTLREWCANSSEDFNAVCVCSDATVTKSRSDEDEGRIDDLGLPATTDPSLIYRRYRRSDMPAVVFSTYQSIDAVMEAQRLGLPEFDMVICDEAHRTTGVILQDKEESNFTKVHSNDNLKAKRRLYMTATPRLYGVKGKEDARKASALLCSMDDESIYGEEFYHISFGKAVEAGLLSDYKVLILTTTASDVPEIVKRHWTQGKKEIDVDTDCKLWGCLNALRKNVAYDESVKAADPEPMHSAVSFCRSIKISKAVKEEFNRLSALPESPYHAVMDHIDGSMTAVNRDKKLTWLKAAGDGCNILSNVRCLSEGVDVPALDAVMFLDSKGSLVDVVQSVGRVMRKAEGKNFGYIIIPIVVPEEIDADEALDDNDRYKVVWQVLRALRSHDERLEAEINKFNWTTKSGRILIGGVGGKPEDELPAPMIGGQYTLDDFNSALMARLVLKVGDREYIENWAVKVATLMPELIRKLDSICHNRDGNTGYVMEFNRYMKGLRASVNDNVTESQGVDMLAQQIIMKPIFEKLFRSDGFVIRNSVSGYIDKMLERIDAKEGLKDIQDKLDDFYDSVELTLKDIDTTEGKQKVITALYEKFFKKAFPADQAINGVVYTPQEIVDFIIHSCADALKEEFGRDMNDEGVNIVDPFTGTGTFIARLMESGLIDNENIGRKYMSELFANEITLLAYYIAAVNIENTFQRITGSAASIPFDNILLTDTFNIEELCRSGGTDTQRTLTVEEEYFVKNRGRIRKEHNTAFTIIMGNPPYGATQKSANDNAKKRKYEKGIDERVSSTYLDDKLFDNGKGLVNSVYDNYIRAFRWATDRIGDNDGIISFVTPSGWLTGSAFEGFRKCIESEFAAIYVFNLRGDQNGANWREEGEKVFGQGSKVGIAITLLVKRKGFSGKAAIKYYTCPDYSKRSDKLSLLKKFGSFAKCDELKSLSPKPNGDWIIERNAAFDTLIPLAGDTYKKFDKHREKTIFVGYSNGYKTAADTWFINHSKNKVEKNIDIFSSEYNRQLDNNKMETVLNKISWYSALKNNFKPKFPIFELHPQS